MWIGDQSDSEIASDAYFPRMKITELNSDLMFYFRRIFVRKNARNFLSILREN